MSKFVDYDSYALKNLQMKYRSIWITENFFVILYEDKTVEFKGRPPKNFGKVDIPIMQSGKLLMTLKPLDDSHGSFTVVTPHGKNWVIQDKYDTN